MLKIFVKNVLFITLNMEVQCIVGLHRTNVVSYSFGYSMQKSSIMFTVSNCILQK